MMECIAMAIGVILGTGCVCLGQKQNAKRDPAEKSLHRHTAVPLPLDKGGLDAGIHPAAPLDKGGLNKDDAEGAENTTEREKLQKQWENFLNYSGNSDGQVKIES